MTLVASTEILAAVREAIAKERERCALLLETTPIKGSEPRSILAALAAEIRRAR